MRVTVQREALANESELQTILSERFGEKAQAEYQQHMHSNRDKEI